MARLSLKAALDYIGVDVKDFNHTRENFARPDFCIHRHHGMQHLYRTMIMCALIAKKIGKPREGLLAFCGAYIHDLARKDDGGGWHHGLDSANERFPMFEELWDKYQLSDEEKEWVRAAVAEHGGGGNHSYKGNTIVTNILKDADALDRARFWQHSRLNPNALNFEESHQLIDVDEAYCKFTREIKDEMKFEDFISECERGYDYIFPKTDIQENILELLKNTGRKGMDKVAEKLTEMGFFRGAASAIHQNNYPGGLADHSLAVYYCALKAKNENQEYSGITDDSIAIACLLHDVCKTNMYNCTTVVNQKILTDKSLLPIGHGEKSVIMLQRWGLELSEDEMLAIRWHMSEYSLVSNPDMWDECANGDLRSQYEYAVERHPLVRLLQQADMKAAKELATKEGINKITESLA